MFAMPSWKYFHLTNLPCSLPAYSRTWEEWRIDKWSEVHPDIDLNVVHKHTNKQIQRAFQDNAHVNTIELKGEHVEDRSRGSQPDQTWGRTNLPAALPQQHLPARPGLTLYHRLQYAVSRVFHHHQVVKKALVEERSKATRPLQPLAPLFPDLGEASLNLNVSELSCFDNFLHGFRRLSHLFRSSCLWDF